MATKISNLQIRQTKFNSTLFTDLNHWSRNQAIKPEVFDEPQRALFASNFGTLDFSGGNPIEKMFGLGKTRYVDDLNWEWKMKVKAFRPLTVLENRTSGTTPGKYRQPITILGDVDIFVIGEVIAPGAADKSQQLVVKNIQKEGRGYVYTLETTSEGNAHYIKPKWLKPGVQWTRFFKPVGEASESGSGTEYFTNVRYKNNLRVFRKQYKVTDFAGQAVLEISFSDENGKIYTSWMDMQQALYQMAMNKEALIMFMYSRLSDKPGIDTDSGYPIVAGAGLEQQIDFGGNVETYTTLSAELLEAFFQKITYARIEPGKLGDVEGLSGSFGMSEFAKALDTWAGGKAIVRESNMFFQKNKDGIHNNSLTAGHLFEKYNLPTGGSFKLNYNPLNDDKSVHREIDPLTNMPLQSQRITILGVAGKSADIISPSENIKMVRKNHNLSTTIIEGRVGPGGRPSTKPTHPGNWYRVDFQDSMGTQVTDPTVLGELIKDVNE